MLACVVLFVTKMANLILASSSPRRRELLQQLGLEFSVYSPNVDESVYAGEQPTDYVLRLAESKAAVVLEQYSEACIIAADTTLAVDDEIIGKPESRAHAFDIWQKLSGRRHVVLTGVCVQNKSISKSIVVQTWVEFSQLSQSDMEHYWATGEPVGKAGGYAIQGIAAQYIPRIEGSYSNVVGLPLFETMQLYQAVNAQN